MITKQQKIIPNLWFDRQAEEAAHFYTRLFKNSNVGLATRSSGEGYEIHGLAEGTVMTIEWAIDGYQMIGINGGPIFKFNPSISFLVACKDQAEVDGLWDQLSRGEILMDLGQYSFSDRYGWLTDRYGLSWQLMFYGDAEITQKLVPTLMFSASQAGRAEDAIRLYTSIFENSGIGNILRYGSDQQPDRQGTIAHASFTLAGLQFAAMDSARPHDFNFNEAVSLMVTCDEQDEIDYYWSRLTATGGQEGACGWLKDPFGVSWQIVPAILPEMLRDQDSKKVEDVTRAFLNMRKFDIAKLKKAYMGY
jgi:predicted 3-demethylubiquinone-9 3-methyltransferase (glyoxalase superfamily)